ncbi:hypothetical protein [Phaeobacter inhibens]|uniref:hypothetical protein n=1 Tax=Phaeobacter inhibens TaxID=221822 RepID=UPI000C9B0259|nr:hypothetical protein [Phaeobacter inhibens]UWR44147.1 hypothetical protein K4F86_12365 [Phaeobacter inhibens]UWR75298.1 hypothetical protein K4L04_12610 [Phaeobacter inhibens]UWR83432.1 hypothetical protein K4L05_11840 [Phaeobacter inhibens]UWR95170.1 hypothetical protein K4K99_12330 [Phaeobacter inhibens]
MAHGGGMLSGNASHRRRVRLLQHMMFQTAFIAARSNSVSKLFFTDRSWAFPSENGAGHLGIANLVGILRETMAALHLALFGCH